ncbi:MAG: LON peptidase substrate-binding domain-containing protein [Pseudomonadota bacterium]
MTSITDVSRLPTTVPVFPLTGAIMLPRVNLPLNLFEPRYLAMFDHALAHDRFIAMVQPGAPAASADSPEGHVAVRRVGGLGRITAFQETDDGRYILALTGVCRCTIGEEIHTDAPFRQFNVSYENFEKDLVEDAGAADVDREHLLSVLKAYLEANDLRADWDAIRTSRNDFLVNSLAMMSPYEAEEKQALLEAPDLKTRAEVLVALAEMELAAGGDGSGSTLQ